MGEGPLGGSLELRRDGASEHPPARVPVAPRLRRLGRKLPPLRPEQLEIAGRGPDWVEANPRRIEAGLAYAKSLPSGGWYVLASKRSLGPGPRAFVIAGRELVQWRGEDGELRVAPDACPHMGAQLSTGRVCRGQLVCPWHGLELGDSPRGRWGTLPLFDDGVLIWVRLPEAGQIGSPRPFLPPRPEVYLDGVIELDGACEPDDVIANRLDPWHGVHFHPYSFAALSVTGGDERVLEMRVAKRLFGSACIEVDVTFHCSDPRTIVMTIVDGEGKGSVVETHATPVGPGRCRIIEATLAGSDRPSFAQAPRVAALVRPFIRRAAQKLWVDDLAYAERRYALRSRAALEAAPARETEGAASAASAVAGASMALDRD